MFSNSHGLQIHGGSYTVHTSSGDSADVYAEVVEALTSRMHFGATYDADVRSDVPKCHEGTRVAIVERIKHWAQAPAPTSPFMWMYGPAGSGKTTIQQTMAEVFFESGALAASFFFSRSADARPRVKTQFVMSLAYQLWFSIPDTRPHIVQALLKDPALPSKNLQKQMDELIIGPLNRLSVVLAKPPIFIVDGLDECEGDDAQWEVLSLLDRLAGASCPLRILVASRPEHIIRTYFSQKHIAMKTTSTPLDNDYQTLKDIRTFLVSQFLDIREKHPAGSNLPADWPPDSDVESLLERSSGQFVYASVVMKYIAEPTRHPKASLHSIVNVYSTDITPFKQLDALYMHVLSSIDAGNLPRVLDILGWLTFQVTTRSGGYRFNGDRRQNFGSPKGNLKALRTLDLISMEEPGTTRTRLLRLSSLLNIPDADHVSLSFSHQSFSDFILDQSRSGRFFVDMRKVHHNLARQWVRFYARHLKAHQTCHHEPVHHCKHPQTVAVKIRRTFDLIELLVGRIVIGNSVLDVLSAIILHCGQGEFSLALKTDLLELDIATALVILYRTEGDDWWMTVASLMNFCAWLEHQPASSIPYEMHGQFFEKTKHAIISCLSVTFSRLDRHHAAVFISCLDEYETGDAVVLLLSDILPIPEQRLIKSILLTLGVIQDKRRVAEERAAAIVVGDPADWVLYSASRILLCKVLSDLPMEGKTFQDRFCYTEYATYFMEGITRCWQDPRRHMARAAPLNSITAVTWNFIRVYLTKAEPDTRLATLLRDHCLQVKDKDTWGWMRQFTLAAVTYMHESGLSYVGHAHSHDLPKQENTCGLCEILLTELVVDCELSQDPQHKPQSMMNDKEIPIPQIQRDFARQFLPFGVFINMYLLLEYLAAFLNRLRF